MTRTATADAVSPNVGQRIRHLFGAREAGVFIALILMCILITLSNDAFLSTRNLLNVGRQISLIGIMAVGMTFVLISGEVHAVLGENGAGKSTLMTMSVENNTVAASLGTVSQLGLVLRNKVRQTSQHYVKQLDTRISSHQQKLRTLSGGNQQKVILARGLATNPSILLLHEPTRGIDVGAKTEIYGVLQRLASEGVTIIIVSSELPELISQCDRILVMYQGRITGEFSHEEATEEAILARVMGQEHIVSLPLTSAEVAIP